MIETSLILENIDPRDLYGSNNRFLNIIKSFFPDLKIIARSNEIKVNGKPERIEQFQDKIEEIILHLNGYNSLSINHIEKIMKNERLKSQVADTSNDTIVFGVNGSSIKTRTCNQRQMFRSIEENDMIFAIGPAGTGKTYTAVALAVRALGNKEIKHIILIRPAVEAGENIGFLPGDLKEKLDPYLQPLYDALREMIPPKKLNFYLETDIIQIVPLAFMRGRTLDKAFVILDEAQNTTHAQMKMFLTRMGNDAKFIITGDVSQIDLPRKQGSGLVEAVRILKSIKGIDFIYLDQNDVIRHRLVKDIVNAYSAEENHEGSKRN